MGLICVSVGGLLGAAMGSPDVETVERVKTHVETETVYEQKPLPESCIKAIEALPLYDDLAGSMSASAGAILLALEGYGRSTVMHDIHHINKTTEIIRFEKDKLDDAVIDTDKQIIAINDAIEECYEDIGESED